MAFVKVRGVLGDGDTLVVTRLDRLGRSLRVANVAQQDWRHRRTVPGYLAGRSIQLTLPDV
jgi:hypothetical protein